jgi:hypothetical protein
VAEVWPLSARPYGIALGASSNWMNNFIVGQVTPDMITNLKYGTFIFFGLITFLGAFFVFFFVPETKQLTLEEMDLVFGSVGVAEADRVRMQEIQAELGLTNGHGEDSGHEKENGLQNGQEEEQEEHAEPVKAA